MVVSPEGLLSPRIGRVPLSTLKAGTNQADYLVIAPREFLEAAQPLVERRRDQGWSLGRSPSRRSRRSSGTASLRRRRSGRSSSTPTTPGSALAAVRGSSRGCDVRPAALPRDVVGVAAAGAVDEDELSLDGVGPGAGGGQRGGLPARPGDRAASGDDAGAGGGSGHEAPGVGGLGAGPLRATRCSWPTLRTSRATSRRTWRTSGRASSRDRSTTR